MGVETIVFILSFVIFTLCATVVLLVVSYSHIVRKIEHLEKEREEVKKTIQKRAVVLLDHAREQAVRVIEDANEKAKEILDNIEVLSQTQKKLISEEMDEVARQQLITLQKTSDDLLKIYQDMLLSIKNENINMFKNISKQFESEALAEVQDFKQIMQQETVGSQKIVEQKLEQNYQEVEKEVDVYRAKRMQQVDESVMKILYDVSKEVFGKGLDVKSQEELVLKCLSEAKQEFSKVVRN